MSIEVKISKRRISYKIAMKFLHKRVEEVKVNKSRELLWILEHPVTYTAGIRSNNKEIIDKKIKIINTNRGGKITLHNPGQKIIYFVLNLNKRKKDIRKLISMIERGVVPYINVDHRRDFIHVYDLITAIKLLMNSKLCGKIDIGTGCSISLKAIRDLLNLQVEERVGQHYERQDNEADINILNSLGWNPNIKLLDYLKEIKK